MTWLVTGSRGMLGTDVQSVLGERGIACTPVDLGDLDLFDEEAVRSAVAGHDVVLNCAAWTAVDDAEAHEADAFAINAVAPGILAAAARQADARMVQISTDYVFGGDASTPYAEDALLRPRSAYGRTKGAGEWAVRAEAGRHLVVRTAWLYGAGGNCFPRTIAAAARQRGSLDVVDDQYGQPTWTRDVADLVVRLVEADAPSGTWHATSAGQTSWWEFAQAIVSAAGMDPALVAPTDSSAYVRPAPRPSYSVLGHDRLRSQGLAPIGDWRERWAAAAPEVLAGRPAR